MQENSQRMPLAAIAAALLTASMCSGCTQSRLYPVCFYNAQPTRADVESVYVPRLREVLRTVIGQRSAADAASGPDGRWFVAQTTKMENDRLQKLWPRVGCIGQTDAETQIGQEANCVSYLAEFIGTQDYLKLSDVQFHGVVLHSEAPDGTTLVDCRSALE